MLCVRVFVGIVSIYRIVTCCALVPINFVLVVKRMHFSNPRKETLRLIKSMRLTTSVRLTERTQKVIDPVHSKTLA